MTKPRILIVDDDPQVGKALKTLIEDRFHCLVSFPKSLADLQQILLLETFDGVLIDANLRQWQLPGKLVESNDRDHTIRNGIDIAEVYGRLRPTSLIVLFGHEYLPEQDRVQQRLKLLPHLKIVEKPLPAELKAIQEKLDVLRPTIEETTVLHNENPIFQPVDAFEGLPPDEKLLKRRHLYREACLETSTWVNTSLEAAGDCSWTVVCGKIQTDFYGERLNGNHHRLLDFEKTREIYPDRHDFAQLARSEQVNPFIFWNTRNTNVLAKQFSDRFLRKIPTSLQDYFGMAVAPHFSKPYNEGSEKEVIEWCRELSPLGQLDAAKEIFKTLNGDRERSVMTFSARCRKARLNRIVDVYNARVEKIVESENTALIELTNFTRDEDFTSPFDLSKLQSKGVKEVDQCFEYTVYADVFDNAFGKIELTE